jgi:hypothetical protein
MPVMAQIGLATTLLELVATSIGYGVIVSGSAAMTAGMLLGRSRKELESNALRQSLTGSLLGMFCLCYDLLSR